MTNDFTNERRDIFPLLFFLLAIATRIPFASRLLFTMDSGQFALALDHFDITVHQPHPPGYFLYVLMGRLLSIVVADANDAFVSISVFFSGLTIAGIYLLGKETFGRNVGMYAALLSLSSPSIWFHGEVSLTYILEACFSTLVALFCWRILRGKEKYLWISAITIGVAGGIRQNTIVFLLPLWMFSIRKLPPPKIAVSFVILAITSLLWFVPMIYMTGGWDAYRHAFHELWKFHTGGNSVFEQGWNAFVLYFFTLVRYIVYGVGLGIFPLSLLFYSLVRRRNGASLDKEMILFLSIWCLPVIFFYLFVFISIQNPGYSLIFLPSFFILIAVSIVSIGNYMDNFFNRNISAILLSVILVSNTLWFLFIPSPVSYRWIRNHDKNLATLLSDIQTFDPLKTAVFVNNYIYYSYRHVMYYLPDYQVYNVDVRITPSGDVRKTFQGIHRNTILSEGFPVPKTIDSFVTPLDESDPKYRDKDAYEREKIVVRDLTPNIRVASGPISSVGKIFPEVRNGLLQ